MLTEAQQKVVETVRNHPEFTLNQLADHLDIAMNTAKNHLKVIYKHYEIEGGVGSNKWTRLVLKLHTPFSDKGDQPENEL